MREGGAAFGRLAELATRRGASAPHKAEQPSSLLPRRVLVPGELCKPPYSRQWLLATRAERAKQRPVQVKLV